MRLSVDPLDPGYLPWRHILKRGAKARVFLGEQELTRVVTADTKTGRVTHIEVDGGGRLAINAKRRAVKLIHRVGKVRIVVERRT